MSYWRGGYGTGDPRHGAVITSFVFGPYVVRGVVGDAEPGGLTANTWLGISTAVAGLLVAAIAPITGQRATRAAIASAASLSGAGWSLP